MTGVERRPVTAGRSAGSSGGQANEGGSLYRSGVAAYLAAHGLKERGVEAAGYAESGPAPVALLFETSEAVDDIRCELADGTAIALQAKRTCGADEQLQKTVSQWVRHLPDLKPGDRIGRYSESAWIGQSPRCRLDPAATLAAWAVFYLRTGGT